MVPLRLISLAILSVTASTLPVFLLGAGYVTISGEFGFGPTGLGTLTAAFFLTAAVASAPLGRVVQRIGWRRAVYVNMAGSAVVLVLISAAANSTTTLGLLLVVAGLFYGLANPAANQALADRVAGGRRAFVFGLKHAGIPASTLLAGLAVPLVIVDLGWRPAYLMALAVVAVVVVLVPAEAAVSSSSPAGVRARTVVPLTTRRLATLAAGASLATWAAVTLGSYLVAAAVDAGLSESAGGLLLFAGSASSLVARIVAGLVTDRTGSLGFSGVAVLTGTGALVFLGLAVVSGAWFALLVPVAFATGWGWPGLMTYTVVNADVTSAAASSAVTQAGIFLGAGLAPPTVGWIVDRWSFPVAFVAVGVLLAIASLVVMSVGRAAARAAAG